MCSNSSQRRKSLVFRQSNSCNNLDRVTMLDSKHQASERRNPINHPLPRSRNGIGQHIGTGITTALMSAISPRSKKGQIISDSDLVNESVLADFLKTENFSAKHSNVRNASKERLYTQQN